MNATERYRSNAQISSIVQFYVAHMPFWMNSWPSRIGTTINGHKPHLLALLFQHTVSSFK